MRTEGVLGRLFSGGAALTTIGTHRGEAAGYLEQRYGMNPPTLRTTSWRDAETEEEFVAAFNYRQHFDHLFGDLETARTAMASAEDEHQRKLMQLEDLTHRREEVGDLLQDLFFKVRQTIETLYSKTQRRGQRWRRGFVLASVSGATPRTPRRFLEQVVQTEKFLRDPAVEPPSLELNGVKVDFTALADDLKPLRKQYSELLDAIDRVRKEADATLAAKTKAIEENDSVFKWVTRACESLFHLAGMHAVAEKIRPSVRRKGRRAVDEEGAPAAENPPSDEASSASSATSEAPPAEASSPTAAAASSAES